MHIIDLDQKLAKRYGRTFERQNFLEQQCSDCKDVNFVSLRFLRTAHKSFMCGKFIPWWVTIGDVLQRKFAFIGLHLTHVLDENLFLSDAA